MSSLRPRDHASEVYGPITPITYYTNYQLLLLKD